MTIASVKHLSTRPFYHPCSYAFIKAIDRSHGSHSYLRLSFYIVEKAIYGYNFGKHVILIVRFRDFPFELSSAITI